MKKTFLLFITFCFSVTFSMAQTNKLDKKLEKANELVTDNKLDDAEKYVENILEKNPEYGSGWDLLAKILYMQYKSSKQMDNLFGNISVTTKDKNGKEVKKENDTLSNQLVEMLNAMKPSKKAYNKYIYNLRKATLFSNDAYHSSMYLRIYFVDTEVDAALSKKALKYFNDAEEEFSKKNYEKAALLYKRAISEQPDFYKASLYLGDAYYASGNYVDAISSFKDAVQRFPKLLEPRKYLTDAYFKEKMYDKSLDEAIHSFLIYSDLSMAVKLDDAAYFNNQKIDIKWMPRAVFPNKIEPENKKSDLNVYEDPNKLVAEKQWVSYQNALPKIKSFCNEKGLITQANSLTQSKYLEVYSWEEMLKNSAEPSLEDARKMQKDGYLDCYVLVTCFHFDLYDQYLDFVTNNKTKVIEYYKKYITSR